MIHKIITVGVVACNLFFAQIVDAKEFGGIIARSALGTTRGGRKLIQIYQADKHYRILAGLLVQEK